jgi:P-type Ca2+ transporter type 2C
VMKYKNNMVLMIVSVTVFMSAILIYIAPFAKFFQFEKLNSTQLIFSVTAGFLSVIWYEAVKWQKRKRELI